MKLKWNQEVNDNNKKNWCLWQNRWSVAYGQFRTTPIPYRQYNNYDGCY